MSKRKLKAYNERECVICGAIYSQGESHVCPDEVLDRIDREDRAQPLEPTGSAPPRAYNDRLTEGWELLDESEDESEDETGLRPLVPN
jgi:hypothetical protein